MLWDGSHPQSGGTNTVLQRLVNSTGVAKRGEANRRRSLWRQGPHESKRTLTSHYDLRSRQRFSSG